MDGLRFDRLIAMLSRERPRRTLLGLVAALPLAAGLRQAESEAARRRQRRKTRQRRERRQRDHDRRQENDARQERRTDAKSEACIPTGQRCPSTKPRGKHGKKLSCGQCCQGFVTADANGKRVCGCTPGGAACTESRQCCGGVCTGGLCHASAPAPPPKPPCTAHSECGADALCLSNGSCQPCAVTCPSGDPVVCGAALQAAMAEGGTVYVCPGTYRGGFRLNTAGLTLLLIGAGEGPDAATNTILDANGAGRVLQINNGVGEVVLQRLRLTGGNLTSGPGAGIDQEGGTLRMTACTVAGNTTRFGNHGAGIFVNGPRTLEMTACTVRDNHNTGGSSGFGGGFSNAGGIVTLTDCLVEGNSTERFGGGLYLWPGSTATLAGSTQVRGNRAGPVFLAASGGGIIVTTGATLTIAETCRVTGNTAPDGEGGGIFNSGGTVTLQGAAPSPIVVNNCHENCAGDTVDKCAATPVSC